MAARVQVETVASVVDEADGACQVRCFLTVAPTHAAIDETEAKLGRIAAACGGVRRRAAACGGMADRW